MIAKIAAVVAGLGLVAMSFVSAVPAKADTTSDLQAQIQSLLAQIASLQAQLGTSGSTSASVTFTRDLTIGSTGSDVTALQNWLITKGFAISAGATGYFGSQTQAALAAYQAANGITPAAGYFGPVTRAKVNASAGTTGTTGGTTGSTTLSGGAGQLKNIDSLGDTESDLHEGDSATKVLGFSADAQDSDIAVQRVDVNVTLPSGESASANKYFDTIAIYQDGNKLASMDASAGDKSGSVWSYRFSDINGVIRDGNTGNFYVEVTPVSSVDSDNNGSITVAIPTDGIRAVDGEGVSETYSVSDDSSNTFTVTSATDGTLTINEASDNPDSTTVKADTDTTTDDVTVLSFNLKAKNQDVTVHDLPVTITTSNATSSDTVSTVKLLKGSTVLKSKSVTGTTTAQTVVFDNIDQTISKDDSENFTVTVSVRKIDAAGSTFTSGSSVTASIPNGGAWDIEDANGNTVSNPSTFTGNAITFQATGITVTKVDASYNKTTGTTQGSGDSTQYSVSFKVTAGDDDLYIGRTITRLASATSTAATNAISWATTSSSNVGVTSSTIGTSLSAADTNSSDTSTVYHIPSGQTRTFTLNVTLNATSTGYTGVQLVGIGYGTSASLGSSYTSGLDTFKTSDVSMTTH